MSNTTHYNFKDQVIFITGAAKGQGYAAALAFAKQGANIIAFDLGQKINYPAYNNSNSNDLAQLKQEIEALGQRIVTYEGDVRNEQDIQNAVSLGVNEFNRIDVLFSNAGIAAYGFSDELTQEQWDSMLDINLKGAWLASKHVIKQMKKQKNGVIIYNSSIAGLRGMNRMAHYSASKFALVGLAKSQAIELAPFGIRVISLHPTGVNTPMNDGLAQLEGTTVQEIAERSAGNLLPVPWIETEDVVEALLYIASDKARFMTGNQFVLDAGLLTR